QREHTGVARGLGGCACKAVVVDSGGVLRRQAIQGMLAWRRTDGPQGRSVIHEHAFDNDGDVLNLASSGLANMVGVTVFAITSDGFALFVQQGAANAVQSSGYAASGSGSLDWGDTVAVQRHYRKQGEDVTLHQVLMA